MFKDHLTLGPNQVLAGGSAFSMGSSYVVALTEDRFGNPTTTAGVSVVSLQSGVSTALGTGSFAAGDPERPGAFVAVASPLQADDGSQNPGTPSSEVELLDANRPAALLASAASLDGDLGLASSTPVSLWPLPSPSGELVAVEVENLLEPPGSDAGLVVLDRSGRVVAEQSPGRGPVSDAFPAWSPDGSALAYVNEGRAGNSIEASTVGAGTVTVPLTAGVGAAECLWSPTGKAVLCDSAHSSGGRVEQTWSVTTPSAGSAVSFQGPGFAVDWFGGQE